MIILVLNVWSTCIARESILCDSTKITAYHAVYSDKTEKNYFIGFDIYSTDYKRDYSQIEVTPFGVNILYKMSKYKRFDYLKNAEDIINFIKELNTTAYNDTIYIDNQYDFYSHISYAQVKTNKGLFSIEKLRKRKDWQFVEDLGVYVFDEENIDDEWPWNPVKKINKLYYYHLYTWNFEAIHKMLWLTGYCYDCNFHVCNIKCILKQGMISEIELIDFDGSCWVIDENTKSIMGIDDLKYQ